MAAIKRLVALFLILVGAAVPLHFVVTRFYDPGWVDASLPVWQVLNPLQVVGLAIVLLVAFGRKRAVDTEQAGSAVTREYLESNFVFYYSAGLMVALLWNWFGVQWSDPPTSDNQLWIIVDVTLPLLFIPTGLRLLREASESTTQA